MVLTPDEKAALVASVTENLAEHGAIVTNESSIEVHAADVVQVSGIVFATSKRDEVFSFTVHPASWRLSGIVRSGEEQSYDVTFDAFLEWIRK